MLRSDPPPNIGQKGTVAMSLLSDNAPVRNSLKDRLTRKSFQECPKCGARGGCAKHGLSLTGISYRDVK